MLVNVLEMVGAVTDPRHHSCPGGVENLGVKLGYTVFFVFFSKSAPKYKVLYKRLFVKKQE